MDKPEKPVGPVVTKNDPKLNASPNLQAAVSASGNDIALAEAQRQVNDIAQAMIPLGTYLEAEGLLVRGVDEQMTVAQIADAALKALQEAKAEIAELTGKVEELTPEPLQSQSKKAKKLAVADSVDDEQFQSANTVVFADADRRLIRDLPALTFSSDKLVGATNGRTLNADIEFPVHGAAHEVAAVFLIDDDGKPVSVSDMVMPISVSGGRSSRINSGSLLFRAPEKPAPKTAKAA